MTLRHTLKKEEEKEWGKKRKCSHIPVSSSTKEGQLLRRHVTWHEFVHRVTDEHVRMLDVVPQVLPDLLLGRASNVYEVRTNLNMRTIDDGQFRSDFLDQGNETRQLRVI